MTEEQEIKIRNAFIVLADCWKLGQIDAKFLAGQIAKLDPQLRKFIAAFIGFDQFGRHIDES